MTARFGKLAWLWLSVLVIVLDQATKHWFEANFSLYQKADVIPGYFAWTLAYNTGAAFSFLADHDGWQRWLFAAIAIGVSRPTVRAGLRALAAMGVTESRHGSGTYITSGPPRLGSEPLSFLAALHGVTREKIYEARRVLEVGAAGLAAERATPVDLAAIAEEVASLFATMDDPIGFLVHDIRFHRAVAAACDNAILASLVEMVSALYYEQRRQTAARATDRNLHDAAQLHRRIYQAICGRDSELARRLMNEHLLHSSAFQAEEVKAEKTVARRARRTPVRRTVARQTL